MKVGDLLKYQYPNIRNSECQGGDLEVMIGTVLEFPTPSHAKEFQKVRVLTDNGIEDWIIQFCKVVS